MSHYPRDKNRQTRLDESVRLLDAPSGSAMHYLPTDTILRPKKRKQIAKRDLMLAKSEENPV